jgi:hypothetical protein
LLHGMAVRHKGILINSFACVVVINCVSFKL